MRNLLVVIVVGATISGCTTLNPTTSWPTDLPEKAYFIQAYQAHSGSKYSSSEIETHLIWIKRFFNGTMLFPTGWNDMSKQLIDSLEEEEAKKSATRRLFELGKIISIEWAQSNNVRKINSSNIGVWGNSLRTSAERSEQLLFITRVEQDVKALLEGTLNSSEISNQRYYPSDEHDNF